MITFSFHPGIWNGEQSLGTYFISGCTCSVSFFLFLIIRDQHGVGCEAIQDWMRKLAHAKKIRVNYKNTLHL